MFYASVNLPERKQRDRLLSHEAESFCNGVTCRNTVKDKATGNSCNISSQLTVFRLRPHRDKFCSGNAENKTSKAKRLKKINYQQDWCYNGSHYVEGLMQDEVLAKRLLCGISSRALSVKISKMGPVMRFFYCLSGNTQNWSRWSQTHGRKAWIWPLENCRNNLIRDKDTVKTGMCCTIKFTLTTSRPSVCATIVQQSESKSRRSPHVIQYKGVEGQSKRKKKKKQVLNN